MKCICEKWIEKMGKKGRIHIAGEAITHCPFCGQELIKDDFRVFITYNGPEDEAMEECIKIVLASFDVKKSLNKKQLYFDLAWAQVAEPLLS